MSSDKNIFARNGEAVSDEEVKRILGINPNSTNINEDGFKAMYNQNVKGYMEQGYPEKIAKSMARKRMDNARGALK